jgi:hypothetical protein
MNADACEKCSMPVESANKDTGDNYSAYVFLCNECLADNLSFLSVVTRDFEMMAKLIRREALVGKNNGQ